MPHRRSRAFDQQAEAAEIAGAASAEAAYQAVHEDEAPLEPGADLTAAAFFDVDNTMMQGASIFHFARGLVASATSSPPRTWCASRCCRSSSGSSARTRTTRTPRARARWRSWTAGRSSQIVELGEEIYDDLMADKIYPRSVELAKKHLDAGQRVWLVTATPQELAQIIAPPARPHRGAGHRRRRGERRLHRPVVRRDAARPGQGRGRPRARRPGGS